MQPQLSVLIVLLLSTFCFGQQQQRNWYYLNNPTETERSNAHSAGCYHGQYGPITLLSCPFPNAQFLVTLPSTTYICAVQTKFLDEDFGMVLSEGNPLLNIDDWYLLTSELDYACLDASESRSLRITVSPTPWKIPKKSQSSKVINVTAVDPYIQGLLDQVDASNIYQSIVTLSNIHTRQAQSAGAREAQNYLAETFRSYGFTVTTHTFQNGYTDNVIAELRGTTSPNEIVVVGAHYDSRSTDRFSTTQRAPGADDNASGTATNLELARVIYQNGVQFERTLRILAFSGEEQGLVGSRAYAAFIANRGDNVVAMFNGDMTGYYPNRPGVPITVGMPIRFIDNQLLASANAITQQYLPDLRVGTTNACCSDQQSFTENGYPAIGYFESELAATAYPGYHTSNDLPGLLNEEQLGLIGKAIIASTLTYAQAYSGEVVH